MALRMTDPPGILRGADSRIYCLGEAHSVVGHLFGHVLMGTLRKAQRVEFDAGARAWRSTSPPTTVLVKQIQRDCFETRRLVWSRKDEVSNENPNAELEVVRRVLAAGGHPNVVRTFDVVADAEHVSLVMEECVYGDLVSILEHRNVVAYTQAQAQAQARARGESPPATSTSASAASPVFSVLAAVSLASAALPVPERVQEAARMLDESAVRTLARQLISAVAFVHGPSVRFAHRDISLENIVLSSTQPWTLKLVDFGMSAPLDDKNVAVRDADVWGRVGKPTYAAPEAWTLHRFQSAAMCASYDGCAADAWSVGICILAMLFGTTLWKEPTRSDAVFAHFMRGSSVRDILNAWGWTSRVSSDAIDVIDGLIKVRPGDRWTLAQASAAPWIANVDAKADVVVAIADAGVTSAEAKAKAQTLAPVQTQNSSNERAVLLHAQTHAPLPTPVLTAMATPTAATRTEAAEAETHVAAHVATHVAAHVL